MTLINQAECIWTVFFNQGGEGRKQSNMGQISNKSLICLNGKLLDKYIFLLRSPKQLHCPHLDELF